MTIQNLADLVSASSGLICLSAFLIPLVLALIGLRGLAAHTE